MSASEHRDLDEQAVEGIAARVVAALREDLRALLADIARPAGTASLTVEQVALHLGVARSTVYMHWREWGGYKLGEGDRAPTRFDPALLPSPGDSQPRRADKRRPTRHTSAAPAPRATARAGC